MFAAVDADAREQLAVWLGVAQVGLGDRCGEVESFVFDSSLMMTSALPVDSGVVESPKPCAQERPDLLRVDTAVSACFWRRTSSAAAFSSF